MKFLFLTILVFSCTILTSQTTSEHKSSKKEYEIQVRLKPFQNQYIYLCRYFGDYIVNIDSALLNEKSEAEFTGSKKLPGGLYVIFYPDQYGNLDFLIDKNQKFKILADINSINSKIEFKNSDENNISHQYQEFMRVKDMEIDHARQGLGKSINLIDSLKWNQKLHEYDSLVQVKKASIIQKNPESLLSTYLLAMRKLQLPDSLTNPKNGRDSALQKKYILKHYFDGIDLRDERLINTPFFDGKVEKYFADVLKEKADTVIKYLDQILGVAKSNEAMSHYLLSKLINGCMYHTYKWDDAVFVHLFKSYIESSTINWLNENEKKEINQRAYFLMGNLIGTPAADIELPDPDNINKSLYDLKGLYTIVGFWDPTCSHCKESLPKLDSMYRAKWKDAGLRIYAVSMESEGTKEDWLNYIKSADLLDWTHVYNSNQNEQSRISMGQTRYLQLYDVWYSPTFYILDKEKRFIAKKLTYPQLIENLKMLLK